VMIWLLFFLLKILVNIDPKLKIFALSYESPA